MSRLPIIAPDEMNAQQRAVYEDIIRTRGGTWFHGPYDPLLLQPRIAQPAQVLGEFLRFHTSIDPRLTEMAILIVARYWDCDFEWYQHAPIAIRAGLSAAVIEDLRCDRIPAGMRTDESAIHTFTHSLLAKHRIADTVYEAARGEFGDVGLVELTALVGYYTFIAFTLNAHTIALPDGVVPPFLNVTRDSLTAL